MGDEVTKRNDAAFILALLPIFVMGLIAAGQRSDAAPGWSSEIFSSALRGLGEVLPLLLACLAATVALAYAGTSRSGRRPGPALTAAATAAFLFVLTVPADMKVVPAVVSILFGWFVAREVFGPESRSFVHPAVLGHVFLVLAWPAVIASGSASWLHVDPAGVGWSSVVMGSASGAIGGASTLACLIGGLIVIARRLVSWRVVLAVPIGAALSLALLGPSAQSSVPLMGHLVGSLTFGAVFLAGLPWSSPSTTSGQWFHGALVGALVILFRLTISSSPDGTLSAILVASIFAPLTDQVVRFGRRQRARLRGG